MGSVAATTSSPSRVAGQAPAVLPPGLLSEPLNASGLRHHGYHACSSLLVTRTRSFLRPSPGLRSLPPPPRHPPCSEPLAANTAAGGCPPWTPKPSLLRGCARGYPSATPSALGVAESLPQTPSPPRDLCLQGPLPEVTSACRLIPIRRGSSPRRSGCLCSTLRPLPSSRGHLFLSTLSQ